MHSFTDSRDRTWEINIDVAALRRAKRANVNLTMPFEDLHSYMMDELFILDALWPLVEEQAKALKISRTEFEAGFRGDATAAARDAIFKELEEYFEPGKAKLFRSAIAATQAELDNANAAAQEAISNGSTDAKGNSDTQSTNSASETS